MLTEERSRRAVEVTENFAEGLLTEKALQKARSAACGGKNAAIRAARGLAKKQASEASYAAIAASSGKECRPDAWRSVVQSAYNAAEAVGMEALQSGRNAKAAKMTEQACQASLIRDIFGNPFHMPLPIAPPLLAWNDGTVRKVAQSIYDERAFDRMPILADALEDAGCENADILNHCREPGVHVRGCWVVDLLLGKA